MSPGWCDCDKQYKYLKVHFQSFEDMMKDPLAQRSWNVAFNNQGWEERWALGTTLRKNIGSWFRQQLIWQGTYEVVHFTMAWFGHENGLQLKATADPPALSPQHSPLEGTSLWTLAQSSKSLDLTSQNVRSASHGTAAESGPGHGAELRGPEMHCGHLPSRWLRINLYTWWPRALEVGLPPVTKQLMVYKQVAYGKIFLMWDLPGFFNSNVVITIQERWISVLTSGQAVATVQIHNVQHGMSCGRLRLAALMKLEDACDASHDSGQFEVSVGHEFKTLFTPHRGMYEPLYKPLSKLLTIHVLIATTAHLTASPHLLNCSELEVNPAHPASATTSTTPAEVDGPAKPATQSLITASIQEGDKSKTPPWELEDDSAHLASAPKVGLESWTPVQELEACMSSVKVPYFKCNQHSRMPAITIVWYASCGVIRILLPPVTFNAKALPEQYNLFIHTVGTEHQVWIWDEGAWKSIKLGYSMFLKGMVCFLIIKNGKPSWVQKDMYLKRLHKS
ncbi:hypothetical protein BDN71DRAFT_1436870 [Pleurotus eryngii]|uniref:Uncharacterized protein n=1 Tax=Pleurotus eryngii TaxID=5323 RepID=A0A9P5ZG41_PLEER|nr:hypothetical protein BDN71DRAFT_1436870 [Pleurotus eryngii]